MVPGGPLYQRKKSVVLFLEIRTGRPSELTPSNVLTPRPDTMVSPGHGVLKLVFSSCRRRGSGNDPQRIEWVFASEHPERHGTVQFKPPPVGPRALAQNCIRRIPSYRHFKVCPRCVVEDRIVVNPTFFFCTNRLSPKCRTRSVTARAPATCSSGASRVRLLFPI
jgi:hypothetical protein